MDLFSPLRFGVQVTTEVVKLATAVPRALLHAVTGSNGHADDDRFRPTAHPVGGTTPANGETGMRTTPAPRTPPRPPEPTSAAGASGGVGGTAAAPGDAARAGAPDPTAASPARPRPVAPRRERTENQVRATPPPREKTVDDAPVLAETEGAASPGAEIHVDTPWTGYDEMKAADVVDRVRVSDPSVKAVVRLYEQQHKKRKSILAATE
jgi:hypothetical protein